MRRSGYLALRSASISCHIEKETQAIASRLATSEARHQESLKRLQDEHAIETTKLKEEIKRLEPLESRAKVLEEEVTKLMTELWLSEQKVIEAEQKAKTAK